MAKAYLDKPGLTYFWEKIKGYVDEHTYGGSINERTVVAPLVSFDDGAEDIPIAKLETAIEPVQDLHGYDNPWPVGGSINKLPAPVAGTYTNNGVTITTDGNGKYTFSGTATDTATFEWDIPSMVLPSTVYVHIMNSKAATEGLTRILFLNGSTNVDFAGITPANRIYTGTSAMGGKTINKVKITVGSGENTNTLVMTPMILDNATATAFVPCANICPISGHDSVTVCRTGANLFNKPTRYMDVKIAQGATIYTEIFGNGAGFNLYALDANGTEYNLGGVGVSTVKEHTAPADLVTLAVSASGITTLGNRNFMVSLSNFTEFEPYRADVYTIDLDGTRYGGTLDVGSGVLTMDKAFLMLNGSENWNKAGTPNNHFRYGYPRDDVALWVADTFSVISNQYATETPSQTYSGLTGISTNTASNTIFICDERFSTVEEFKTYLSTAGVEVCYRLATPQTVQLTAEQVTTLQGHNNIWSDMDGDLTVKYCADGTFTSTLKKYVPTMDDIYPVGSIYMSVNNVSPATLFGGTWEQLQDRFLLAAGSTYTAGSTGGKKTHTHTYGVKWASNWGLPAADTGMIEIKKSDGTYQAGTRGGTGTFTVNKGANATESVSAGWFSNEASVSDTSSLPPYLAVYMWKRTA